MLSSSSGPYYCFLWAPMAFQRSSRRLIWTEFFMISLNGKKFAVAVCLKPRPIVSFGTPKPRSFALPLHDSQLGLEIWVVGMYMSRNSWKSPRRPPQCSLRATGLDGQGAPTSRPSLSPQTPPPLAAARSSSGEKPPGRSLRALDL